MRVHSRWLLLMLCLFFALSLGLLLLWRMPKAFTPFPVGHDRTFCLRWSPDGRYLAYMLERSMTRGDAENVDIICLLELATRKIAYSSSGPRDWQPIWEPDGHGLAISADGKYSVEFAECLAACGTAPVIMINDDFNNCPSQSNFVLYHSISKEILMKSIKSL